MTGIILEILFWLLKLFFIKLLLYILWNLFNGFYKPFSSWDLENEGDKDDGLFREPRAAERYHEFQIDDFIREQKCADDAIILDKVLKGYDIHAIPNGQVEVEVEVLFCYTEISYHFL